MAITNPTIIVNNSGGVSVTMVGMSYQAFLNMLGSNVFRVLEIFMTASSMPQLLENIQYVMMDANGVVKKEVINKATDPYQKIPALRVDLRDYNIILNGQSNLIFNMLPNENLMLQLISDQESIAQQLDSISPSNFELIETGTFTNDYLVK